VPERERSPTRRKRASSGARRDPLELNAIIDDEDVSDEARREAEEKAEALEREIADLRDKPPILAEALKPKLGTFLLLGDDGVPRLDAVFYAEPEPEVEPDHDGSALRSCGCGSGTGR
jgi:ParB family chromosome partitioning protein